MTDNTLTIVFSGTLEDGRPLRPDTVSVTELLSLLAPIEQSIALTAGEPGRVLSLIACRESSSANECVVADGYLEAAHTVHQAVKSGDLSPLPRRAQRALVDYSKRLTRHEWSADLHLPDGGSAVIDAEHPLEESGQPILLREARSLYGKVVKAGGVDATKFIHLEVLHKKTPRRVLAVDAEEALVKEVSARMFEVVHLAGEATYDVTNKQVVAFRATRLLPYRATPPSTAFDQLRDAVGSAFDEVDPIAFQRDLRDGGER